jgi:putative ubiquitin-RnfH superfamily antitoxin RatB of RatAB toxin-antitoxin module
VNVTVVWATPEVQDVAPVAVPSGATVANAVEKSGLLAQYGLDPMEVGFAIFGHRARPDAPLAEGDRIELTRALQVDPKAARVRRARENPLPRSTRRRKLGQTG